MALLLTAAVILLALVHVHAVACLALVEPRRAEAHLRVKYVFLDILNIFKAVLKSILDLSSYNFQEVVINRPYVESNPNKLLLLQMSLIQGKNTV